MGKWNPDSSAAKVLGRTVADWLPNLHDVFLNASVVRKCMYAAPVKGAPERFDITNRARLERIWVAFLAVLVESWSAPKMKAVRDHIGSVVDTSELTNLLSEARRSGRLKKLKECRHYMFHRDEREYWDVGRLVPEGELDFYENLHMAFSKVLLAAMRHANTEIARRRGAVRTRYSGGRNRGLSDPVPPTR